MTTNNTSFDIIVVGGGPAGMMAAGTAAAKGKRVLLLEKNASLGKKLLITGGGRCNLTNDERNVRTLLAHYKASQEFLFSPFAQFGVVDTLDFFHTRGLATKVEDNQRVFPVTDSAQSVFAVLETYLTEGGVTIKTNAPVAKISASGDTITELILKDGAVYTADAYIIATGGTSRPETGSTGDGFLWLKQLGHTVATADPSLVPIRIKETWVAELAGVTLPEVKLTIYQNSNKQTTKIGRILFPHTGLSGPMILNLSKHIGELLEYGTVTITLDLFPRVDHGTLDTSLITEFKTNSNKLYRNIIAQFLSPKLAPVIVRLSGINPDIAANSITRAERRKLVHLLKSLPFTVHSLLGKDKAIVTSGGVSLAEVDTRTMRSSRYKNLYLVGDVLNIDRPSGGYSLQLCWTTGHVAGCHAA